MPPLVSIALTIKVTSPLVPSIPSCFPIETLLPNSSLASGRGLIIVFLYAHWPCVNSKISTHPCLGYPGLVPIKFLAAGCASCRSTGLQSSLLRLIVLPSPKIGLLAFHNFPV